MGGNHRFGPDADVVDQDVAARCCPLTEARPIVDDRQTRRVARSNRKMDVPALVDRADVDEMREQGARGVELLAVDDKRVAVAP